LHFGFDYFGGFSIRHFLKMQSLKQNRQQAVRLFFGRNIRSFISKFWLVSGF